MPAEVKLTITGVNSMGDRLARVGTMMFNSGGIALEAVAEEIKRMSQQECPSVTGALRDSAFVSSQRVGNDTIVRVGYGGNAAQINPRTGKSTNTYMVPVHERVNAVHPTGKAKFLEDPINQHIGDIVSMLIANLAQGG